MRLNFAAQIAIGTVAIQAVMITVLIVSGTTQIRDNQDEVLERFADQQTRLLGSALSPGLAYADPGMLQEMLDELEQDTTLQYAVVKDADARTMAEAGSVPDGLPQEEGLRQEPGELEMRIPVQLAEQYLGSIVVGYSTDDIDALATDLMERNIALAVGVLALSILAATLFSLVITRRLRRLKQGGHALQQGDLQYRVEATSNDEFGDLARTFNNVAAHLETTQDEIRQQNRQLNHSVARLESMLAGADAILWEANPQNGGWEFVAGDTRHLLGYSVERLSHAGLRVRRIHPEDLPRVQGVSRDASQHPKLVDYRFRHRDGHWMWLRDILSWAADDRGEPVLRGLTLNITAHRQAADALHESESRYEEVVNNISEVIFRTDAEGRWTLLNPAWEKLTGFSLDESLGRSLCEFVATEDQAEADQVCRTLMQGEQDRDFAEEIRLRTREGNARWVSVFASTRRDERGRVIALFGTIMDISDRKRAEEEVRRLAFFDNLTHLPNRTLLHDRLRQSLAHAHRTGLHGAALFLDLDNFKDINDTLGHAVGDELLQQVAARLSTTTREADTLARLGGDEFVLVLNDLNADQDRAATQAEAVGRKLIELMREPFPIGGQDRHVSPSIGATLFSGDHLGVQEVLKQADLAMYRAKNAGRNTVRFYDPELHRAVEARFQLETELREALRRDEFEVHCQLQVNSDDRPVGAELLLRWAHPERGWVSPGEFIPVAEQTGLIVPIGQRVLEEACRRLAQWKHDPALRDLTLSVNVSARQFRHGTFVAELAGLLEATGAPGHRLKLEITESMLLEDIDHAIDNMQRLRELGIGFALDDFGTGYSSLAYLKQLPLSQLKIDQSFVRDVLNDPNDAAIAEMVVNLAHTLRLDVIAEGVETEDQRAFLMHLGCWHFQGFLYGRPATIETVEALAGTGEPLAPASGENDS